MPASSPYFAIDLAVHRAFTEHVGLTALCPVNKMQLFDRAVDTRGNVQDARSLGKRLWIQPVDADDRWAWSSSAAKFAMAYIIGVGSGDMRLEESRILLWQVDLALARLYRMQAADGSPLGDIGCAPLVLQNFIPGGLLRPREPWEDEPEWQFERSLVATVLGPLAELAPDVGPD